MSNLTISPTPLPPTYVQVQKAVREAVESAEGSGATAMQAAQQAHEFELDRLTATHTESIQAIQQYVSLSVYYISAKLHSNLISLIFMCASNFQVCYNAYSSSN